MDKALIYYPESQAYGFDELAFNQAISDERLYIRYCDYLKDKDSTATLPPRKQFQAFSQWLEQQFAQSQLLSLTSLKAKPEDSLTRNLADWKIFCQIADESLQDVSFNLDIAFIETSRIKSGADVERLDLQALHSSPQNLGIREKYTQGILTGKEWLNEVDLERMLELTGTRGKIHIYSLLPPENVGHLLHLKARDRGDALPYTVPIILNLGSQGKSQGSHYIAASININPETHGISYRLTDSMAISEDKKALLKQQIEDAIDAQFPAADWHIRGEVVSNNLQMDGYSCGYRALYTLLQDESIRESIADEGKKRIADNYVALNANDSSILTQFFYTQQLSEFSIGDDLFAAISPAQQQRLSLQDTSSGELKKYSVRPGDLDNLFSLKETSLRQQSTVANEVATPVVSEALECYRPNEINFTFPGESKDLLATDYEAFFTLLENKVETSDHRLEMLFLMPCSLEAVDGLNAYLTKNSPLPFNELAFDLDFTNVENKAITLARLQTLLVNLNNRGLEALQIEDKQTKLQEEDWKSLLAFIKVRKIALNLILPEVFNTSQLQKEFDEAYENNKVALNQQKIDITQQSIRLAPIIKKPKRTRQKMNGAEVSTDIEQQQEQQVEVAQEKTQMAVSLSVRQGNLPDFPDGLSFDYVETQLPKGELAAPTFASGLLKPEDYPHFLEIIQGDITDSPLNSEGKASFLTGDEADNMQGVSIAAYNELLRHFDTYKTGIDFEHLPAGFKIITNPEDNTQRRLHFDKDFLTFAGKKALTPAPLKKQPALPFTMQMIDSVLAANGSRLQKDKIIAFKNKLSQPYHRKGMGLFKQHFANLLRFNAPLIERIQTLCFEGETFNTKRFEFIVSHYQTIIANYQSAHVSSTNERVDPTTKTVEAVLGSKQNGKLLIEALLEEGSILAFEEKSHPLFTLVKSEHIKQQIKSYGKRLDWGGNQLDALLKSISHFGEAGLNRIVSQLRDLNEKGLLEVINHTVLRHGDNLNSLIADSNFLATIDKVAKLPSDYKAWFLKLLKNHGDSIGEIDLTKALADFYQFSDRIKTLGLSFKDSAIEPLNHSGHFTVTLGRMITILESCDPGATRKLQWQALPQLELSSSGALRVLYEQKAKRKRLAVILPEMHLTAEAMAAGDTKGLTEASRADIKSLLGIKDSSEIADGDDKTLYSRFYRYINHCDYHLPITFYQQAVALFEEKPYKSRFSFSQKKQLLTLLAKTTTGFHAVEAIDKGKAITEWQSFIDEITKPQLNLSKLKGLKGRAVRAFLKTAKAKKMIGDELLDSFITLDNPPFLSVLNKVTNTIKHGFSSASNYSEFSQNQGKLLDAFYLLNVFTQKEHFGEGVYDGMGFYSEAEYSASGDIFYKHLIALGHIARAFNNFDLSDEFKPLLASIISQFNLINIEGITSEINIDDDGLNLGGEIRTINTFVGLLSAFSKSGRGPHYIKSLFGALSHIKRVEKDDGSRLSISDLDDLVYNLFEKSIEPGFDDKKLYQEIKNQMGQCFDSDYLDGLIHGSADKTLLSLIDERIENKDDKQLILKFITKFNKVDEADKHLELAKSLISFYYQSEEQGSRDLSRLFKTFLQGEKGAIVSIDDFILLLDKSSTQMSALDFFISQYQKSNQVTDSENLLDKALLYLDHYLPNMKSIGVGSTGFEAMNAVSLICELLSNETNQALKDSYQTDISPYQSDSELLDEIISNFSDITARDANLNDYKKLLQYFSDKHNNIKFKKG